MAHEVGTARAAVRVRAPARLHFGFLDLHGGLGRRFGSIGLSLDAPAIDLTAARADSVTVTGTDLPGLAAECERVRAYAAIAARHLGVPEAGAFHLAEAIPAHAGFGSGTQLALAVAAALAALHGAPFAPAAFADALDRGNRSGVGLAAFVTGGLIVDGGRDDGDAPPPVIARLPFPEPWRVVLILDAGRTGVHGSEERRAFRELPRFPAPEAAEICRTVLMQVLPALVTEDLDRFGSGITAVQRRIGDYFAPHQGGRYASEKVAAALGSVEAAGIAGFGQSSWGPTGFALTGSDAQAQALVASLRARHPDLAYRIARGRNRGAEIGAP
ncbi:beta-ribofuranosylaminobenzene 5'-phosphate synthase family protein [Methylobacterium nonmethylotrophicum]|uniref:GHMP kinase n=1 Tax=Methylobacterium nonmethylotrophicum TaxID=1141884 RepID=A0A4Z0NHZ6_9HYPH|nr:beta-ribofuranosylaminobenzene 5'-phosphate synthase family protein [Methylobacterium nonmethylotrophicum]TGD95343.1 GHMP kinase [Methylobacterium nonmethylotrophicum]